MTQIDISYGPEFSTQAILKESGWEIPTNLVKCSPTDLFAAALGSCVLTVMGLAAQKMGVDFQGAKVRVTKEMDAGPPRRISPLKVYFTVPCLPEKEICHKLEKIGKDCPVHNSLHPDISVEFVFQWGHE